MLAFIGLVASNDFSIGCESFTPEEGSVQTTPNDGGASMPNRTEFGLIPTTVTRTTLPTTTDCPTSRERIITTELRSIIESDRRQRDGHAVKCSN